MKSNCKIGRILSKIKKSYRNFMFVEETVKRKEEEDKLPFKERIKLKWKSIAYITFLVTISLVILFVNQYNIKKNEEAKKESIQGTYITTEDTRETKKIESQEISEYMINSSTGESIKISKSTLDGQIAYSLSYNKENINDKELVASARFTTGHITKILISGYPNVGYEDLGLESEDEAYIATQLALYAMVYEKQYSMSDETFILDDVVSSNDESKETVERIKKVAKALYEDALENPYQSDIGGSFYEEYATMSIDGNLAVWGPYYSKVYTDEDTIAFMGDEYNPLVDIELRSYINDSNATVINKEGKEVANVKDGEAFYIKVEGTEKIFSQFKASSVTYFLYSAIYSTNESNSKYVLLSTESMEYFSIVSLIHNLPSGTARIEFISNDDVFSNVAYRIYNEDDVLIQDVGYSLDDVYALPEGKYYIEVYDILSGYFIENKIQEFEVKADEETKLTINIDSVN